MRRGIGGGHQAAERVADQHHVLEEQPLDKVVQRVRIVARFRRRRRQELGLPIAGRIPGDEAIALEALELAEPARRARADAVHQQERLPAAALAVRDGLRLPGWKLPDALVEHGRVFSPR